MVIVEERPQRRSNVRFWYGAHQLSPTTPGRGRPDGNLGRPGGALSMPYISTVALRFPSTCSHRRGHGDPSSLGGGGDDTAADLYSREFLCLGQRPSVRPSQWGRGEHGTQGTSSPGGFAGVRRSCSPSTVVSQLETSNHGGDAATGASREGCRR